MLQSVNGFMPLVRLNWGVLVIAGILLSGCTPSSSSTYQGTSPKPTDSNPNNLGSGTNKEEPPKGLNPANVKPEIKFDPKTFAIEPKGAGNYTTSAMSIQSLGQKVDKSLAELNGALGKCNANFEVGGAKTTGESTWKVKNPTVFHIQYLSSETEATTNRLISDGTKSYSFFKETWTETAKSLANGSKVDQLVSTFPENFTRTMLAKYEYKLDVFGPLFSAIANRRLGFSGNLEEQTAKVYDKDRKVYRLVAHRKTPPADFEIVVDGERFLPLTIRSVVPTKDDKDTRMWTCQWLFGGKYEDREFLIPLAAKGP